MCPWFLKVFKHYSFKYKTFLFYLLIIYRRNSTLMMLVKEQNARAILSKLIRKDIFWRHHHLLFFYGELITHVLLLDIGCFFRTAKRFLQVCDRVRNGPLLGTQLINTQFLEGRGSLWVLKRKKKDIEAWAVGAPLGACLIKKIRFNVLLQTF